MCVRAHIRVPVVLHFAPLKCPAGGGEITGALKNGDRVVNRLSALMRESAVPKRLVGGGVPFRPLPGLVVIHQGPTRGATHADKQERHEHAGSGKWDTRQSGVGERRFTRCSLGHGPTLKVLAYLGQSSWIPLKWTGPINPPPVPAAPNTMAVLAAVVSAALPVSQIEINELPALTAG